MKIDQNATLTKVGGGVIQHSGRDATLANIMVFALTNAPPSQQDAGPEMWKRHKLAQKIDEAEGVVDLSAEEVSIIKATIAAVYHTAIAGPAWEVIEA